MASTMALMVYVESGQKCVKERAQLSTYRKRQRRQHIALEELEHIERLVGFAGIV